ncbi:NUDIX hydrolase [Solicola sp. PLA-1-18]|uniref:NUDIX hydrolase n=1 Tax=Solicola sp. PLA-1-18 TaxID=3380532 RepID=UPI003B7F9DB0
MPAEVDLAVSTVIFALRQSDDGASSSLWIPLVRRIREPYEGRWALPGGPLEDGESLDDAARRNLVATTALSPTYLEQLYSFGTPDRSPGARVVSIVYWALVQPEEAAATVEDDNVRWFEAEQVMGLAFDHDAIVAYALWRLRTKVEYTRLAHAFLGEEFTLAQLRQVYEVVLQQRLDPANFRRQVEADGTVVATGRFLTGGRHRPPRLYRYAPQETS